MKRRKRDGTPGTGAPKAAPLVTTRHAQDAIVGASMQASARAEIRQKLLDARRRSSGKERSKQPPLSEEMKDVTEIGSRRWKSGQTK